MGKKLSGTPNDVVVDESKVKAAAQATMRKHSSKKGKQDMKIWVVVGSFGAFMVLAIYLAMAGDPGKKNQRAPSGDSALVSENSFIRNVASDAAGNFTTAAQPFFKKWTYADLKYGLEGSQIHGEALVGMAGALQRCEADSALEGGALPTSYDVREAHPGCLPEPYNSGNCSSSYAIAATSAVSARFCVADAAKYGKVMLAPQQVLSCDKKSKGCKGGGIDSVFDYIKRRGLYPEECLPFAGAKEGVACKTTCEESKKRKILDYCLINGEKTIKREILNRGPVVAPLYLMDDYLVYSGGIYSPTTSARRQYGARGKAMLYSAVIVGWGKSPEGVKYWILQNSFGKDFGETGYSRVAIETVIIERYILVPTPATDEAVAEQERKEKEAKVRAEEVRKERAARDERIAERRAQYEADMKAQEAAEFAELDDDKDFEGLDEEVEVPDTEM